MDLAWNNHEGVALRLLDATLALPLQIDSLDTSQLHLAGATGSGRTSTVLALGGAGAVGRGEDVAYSPETQSKLPETYKARTDLLGEWTIGSLAAHLDEHPLRVRGGEGWDDKGGYHRWALEAAALDLALRQQRTSLAELVGAEWSPVRVSLSMGLGTPPSTDVLQRWLARDPTISFKLDTSMAWDHALVARLTELGAAVATIDFKALYHGDWIDNDYPVTLYEAVADGLPHALLEDARLDADTLDAFDERALGRLAWDYPITEPRDVPGLPGSTARFSDLRPAAINIKPSRFGSLQRLLGTIIQCEDHGIPCYSGGQYELGIGRTQVQSITSLCFPDAPNDCAPVMFHGAAPDADDVPLGPVVPPAGHVGFGWDAPTRATRA